MSSSDKKMNAKLREQQQQQYRNRKNITLLELSLHGRLSSDKSSSAITLSLKKA